MITKWNFHVQGKFTVEYQRLETNDREWPSLSYATCGLPSVAVGDKQDLALIRQCNSYGFMFSVQCCV